MPDLLKDDIWITCENCGWEYPSMSYLEMRNTSYGDPAWRCVYCWSHGNSHAQIESRHEDAVRSALMRGNLADGRRYQTDETLARFTR